MFVCYNIECTKEHHQGEAGCMCTGMRMCMYGDGNGDMCMYVWGRGCVYVYVCMGMRMGMGMCACMYEVRTSIQSTCIPVICKHLDEVPALSI